MLTINTSQGIPGPSAFFPEKQAFLLMKGWNVEIVGNKIKVTSSNPEQPIVEGQSNKETLTGKSGLWRGYRAYTISDGFWLVKNLTLDEAESSGNSGSPELLPDRVTLLEPSEKIHADVLRLGPYIVE